MSSANDAPNRVLNEDETTQKKSRFSHSDKLFVRMVDNQPMLFCVTNSDERVRLKPLIQHGGGCVTSAFTPSDKYVIYLTPAGKRPILSRPTDVFISTFIDDSIKADKVADLRDYHMTETYFDYDPNDVLQSRRSWNDVQMKPSNSGASASADSSGSGGDGKENDDDKWWLRDNNNPTNAASTTPPSMIIRHDFTLNDKHEIIQALLNHTGNETLSGNELWKRLVLRKTFRAGRRHTWQSLREHFLKQIFTRIDSFGLNAAEVNEFRTWKSKRRERSRMPAAAAAAAAAAAVGEEAEGEDEVVIEVADSEDEEKQ